MRLIPEDNLGYPVLITLPNGRVGSGVYVNDPDTGVYLATAKHVLIDPDTEQFWAPSAQLVSYSKNPLDEIQNQLALNLLELHSSGNVHAHPQHDVLVIRLFQIHKPQPNAVFSPGVGLQQRSSTGLVCVGVELFQKSENVLIGNDSVLYGYPKSIGLKQIPQIEFSKPLLRKGMIAGINRSARTIVLDCTVYPGNSGGPVFQIVRELTLIRFFFIGIAIQFVPFLHNGENSTTGQPVVVLGNSGYSIVAPAEFVLECITALK